MFKNTVHYKNFFPICLLIAVSIVYRIFMSELVETGGDAVFKWAMIRDYVEHGVMPSFDQSFRIHHILRWSLNIPVVFLMELFGSSPENYYFWPFIISTVGAVFIYLLVTRLTSVSWGIVASLLFISSIHMLRQGSQFLPMGPATAYLIICLYFLNLWSDSKKVLYLILTTVFLFFSYGAKITSIIYVPAIAIIVFVFSQHSHWSILSLSRQKMVVVFLVLFSFMFIGEYVVTEKFSDIEHGRIGYLMDSKHGDPEKRLGAHLEKIDRQEWRYGSYSASQYASNILAYYKMYPEQYPPYGKYIVYLALVVSVVFLCLKKSRYYFLIIPYFFGFFFHAYAIISVNPYMRPEKFNFRYLSIVYTLATIIVLLALYELSSLSNKYIASHNVLRFLKNSGYLVVGVFLLAMVVKCLHNAPACGFFKVKSYARQISTARRTHTPVVLMTNQKRKSSENKLNAYLSLFSPNSAFYNIEQDYPYGFLTRKEGKILFIYVENQSNTLPDNAKTVAVRL